MVTGADRTTFDHMAACELAEKRAIAVYGAVFAKEWERGEELGLSHRTAEAAAAAVPRPEPYRVPTALERQQAAGQVNAAANPGRNS